MKRILLLIFILGIVGIIVYLVWDKFYRFEQFISPVPNVGKQQNITPSPTSLPSSSSLKNIVEETLLGTKGTYGIVVKNLITGEAYYHNEHKVYEPGSLYKLWVMGEVYNQIQSGKLTEDEILTDSIRKLNNDFDIDPDSVELAEGTITLSVKDALNQMITISHNYAAFLLTKKVQLSSIETFLKEHNFSKSALGSPPKTTAYDIALFFEKLYKEQLANGDNTRKMIDLLKRQTLNNKLPKYLPQNVAIAHKTGEINYLSHDAGIIFTGKGDYIIAILSETDAPAGAEEQIAKVSAAVYKYFVNK